MKEGTGNDGDYTRQMLDALPAPLFVVDEDVGVHDLNSAARAFVGGNAPTSELRLCGEVLRCAHVLQSEEICGDTVFCPNCVVRASVGSAYASQSVVRRWAKMQLLREGQLRTMCFLISAAPLPRGDKSLVLLVLEDVTEIAELRALLPICSVCGKVRSEDDYWHNVQEYLRRHTAMRFTHGVCPDCIPKLYEENAPPSQP